MKTPQEAKHLYCPLFTIAAYAGGTAPLNIINADKLCRGPDCMWWRKGPVPVRDSIIHEREVTEEPEIRNGDYVAPERQTHIPDNYEFSWCCEEQVSFWIEPQSSAKARCPGWCGLAGEPE